MKNNKQNSDSELRNNLIKNYKIYLSKPAGWKLNEMYLESFKLIHRGSST
jgi:hypothetical protein